MIEMQEVDKNYNDFHFHLSMKIPKGQITGLIGKNGAGKSTAIKLILGLIKPDSGTVKVFGTPIKNWNRIKNRSSVYLWLNLDLVHNLQYLILNEF